MPLLHSPPRDSNREAHKSRHEAIGNLTEGEAKEEGEGETVVLWHEQAPVVNMPAIALLKVPIAWAIAIGAWVGITMAAPIIADNRPRRDLDSWEIDSQI